MGGRCGAVRWGASRHCRRADRGLGGALLCCVHKEGAREDIRVCAPDPNRPLTPRHPSPPCAFPPLSLPFLPFLLLTTTAAAENVVLCGVAAALEATARSWVAAVELQWRRALTQRLHAAYFGDMVRAVCGGCGVWGVQGVQGVCRDLDVQGFGGAGNEQGEAGRLWGRCLCMCACAKCRHPPNPHPCTPPHITPHTHPHLNTHTYPHTLTPSLLTHRPTTSSATWTAP